MMDKNKLPFYKGHIKDVKSNSVIDGYLNDNPQLLLVHKKTERLIAATYMITDLFDDREPLKWELRTKSVSLLSFISSLSTCPTTTHEGDTFVGAVEVLSDMLFPLELAMHTRLVSPMNFSILKDEYLFLGSILESCARGNSLPRDFTFPENFFAHDDTELGSLDKREKYNKGHKGHNDVFAKGHKISDNKIKEGGTVNIKDNEVHLTGVKKYKKDESRISRRSFRPAELDVKEGRRSVIIRLLRTKGESTVKDISSVIADCSEKTIQRELLSLTETGIVSKKGERRWSTYSLK